MRILVTGVGGPTPRSFAVSLKKYGSYKKYELIGTDVNPLSIGLYQSELFARCYVVPKATDEDYWDAVRKIIVENKIDFAVVLPEVEVLVWSRKAMDGAMPCRVLLPDSAVAELLIDKGVMSKILNDIGLVPKSVEFSSAEIDLAHIFNKLNTPFWVRSSSGTSGLGSLKIENIEALRNWIQINPNVDKFLASEFLPGRNLACKMLYYEGKLMRAACAERVQYIMSKVAPSGITGNTSFGRLLYEPKLVKIAERAIERIYDTTRAKKHGFFTVDFKEDAAGIPLITEINVRHVAFTQCFAAAGANFAEDTIRLLDNDPSFNRDNIIYKFEEGLIFLRDVDALPIVMNESELIN